MTDIFMYMSDFSALLLIVFYLPICIVLLWIINRIFKNDISNAWIRRGLLACLSIVMFLLPTWDAILAKYYLDKLCLSDGGVTVHEKVEVDGYYMPTKAYDFTAKKMLNEGYAFFEMDADDVGYISYSISEEGELIKSRENSLLSKYAIKSKMAVDVGSLNGVTAKLNYQYIENIRTGKIVSEYRNYYVNEGFLDKIWASAFGGGYIRCDEAFSDMDKFDRKKLTP